MQNTGLQTADQRRLMGFDKLCFGDFQRPCCAHVSTSFWNRFTSVEKMAAATWIFRKDISQKEIPEPLRDLSDPTAGTLA